MWATIITLGLICTMASISDGLSPFKKTSFNKASVNQTPSIVNQNNFLPSDLDLMANVPNIYDSGNVRNPFEIVYEWRFLDFEYPTYQSRQLAIAAGDFVPENNLPLGVDVFGNRLFITMPRWKNGIPASFSWLPLPPVEKSPPMRPYPNWEMHGDPNNPDCSKLMSVYRIYVDDCSRLWIIDAGAVNATIKLNQICPPKIVIFDLTTDEIIRQYELPPDQVKEDSLHTNIIVDIRDGQCNDAFAYVTDVWRFGVVVYSFRKDTSWRITNHNFYPNPTASDFTLHGLNFQWTDGVFGMSLSPINEYNDRLLFFHPMASYKEFMVTTSVVRDENLWLEFPFPTKEFALVGGRGPRGQSSTAGIDRNNVMFYTLVHQDAVGCWDTKKSYTPNNLGLVAENSTTLFFPNDLKVDHEPDQGIWVLSNRLPVFLYAQLDYTDINFRIHRASTADAVKNSVCDPDLPQTPAVHPDICECE